MKPLKTDLKEFLKNSFLFSRYRLFDSFGQILGYNHFLKNIVRQFLSVTSLVEHYIGPWALYLPASKAIIYTVSIPGI